VVGTDQTNWFSHFLGVMSQVLNLGSDMGFSKFDTKDFSQKSPLAGNVCASPMSQISTAPCTPSLGLMPDPETPPSRQLSAVSALDESTSLISKKSIPEEDGEEISCCIEKPPLLSGLATWAQQQGNLPSLLQGNLVPDAAAFPSETNEVVATTAASKIKEQRDLLECEAIRELLNQM